MANEFEREDNLARLTYSSIKLSNQHYIATYFIKEDIAVAIEKYANGNLLDVGCGNKPYEVLFKEKVKNYIGCDIIQSNENVVDFLCPANRLCFEDNFFDTVFSTQVIEHVEDHNGMIRESFRVLRPGGFAIYTAPFCWELHEEPYDFFRFSKYGLIELFRKHGFEVELIKSNGGKWAAISQIFLNVLLSVQKYGTIRGKIIKWLFVKSGFIKLYNRFSIWLDQTYFDDCLTLNYIVVARKPL